MATEEEFTAALARVDQLTNDPGNETKLRLYALYKQATVGDVTGKKPGFADFVGKAKYQAWAELKGTSADAARQDYVELVNSLS